MKYTPRHIQRFLEQGRIDPTLWKNHFQSLLPSKVPTCGDCSEFREKTCPGGREPVECILSKKPGPDNDTGTGHRKKRRDPMLGFGARAQQVHGTAKPPDQSKM